MRDLPLNNFVYKDEDYDFAFANQNEAFHPSLIVRPKNLKVLRNETDNNRRRSKGKCLFYYRRWIQHSKSTLQSFS